jgi:hypothetical protein
MKTIAIGDAVYKPYTPAVTGIVVAVHQPPERTITRGDGTTVQLRPLATYTVKRPNGTEFQTEVVHHVSDLVDDHRRKLAKHEQTLAALNAFRATLGLEVPVDAIY